VINNGDTIVWNGKNTEDVISFCCSWDYDLCSCHNVYTNLINGWLTLSIEPADTMRKSCFDIQLGQMVTAIVADGYRKILKAEQERR